MQKLTTQINSPHFQRIYTEKKYFLFLSPHTRITYCNQYSHCGPTTHSHQSNQTRGYSRHANNKNQHKETPPQTNTHQQRPQPTKLTQQHTSTHTTPSNTVKGHGFLFYICKPDTEKEYENYFTCLFFE